LKKTGIQMSVKRVQTTDTVTVQRLVHQRVTRPSVTPPALISFKFFKVEFSGIDEFLSWVTVEQPRFTLTLLNPDVVQQPVTLITHSRKHCYMQKVMSINKLQMSIRNSLVNHTHIGLVLQNARSSFTQ